MFYFKKPDFFVEKQGAHFPTQCRTGLQQQPFTKFNLFIASDRTFFKLSGNFFMAREWRKL